MFVKRTQYKFRERADQPAHTQQLMQLYKNDNRAACACSSMWRQKSEQGIYSSLVCSKDVSTTNLNKNTITAIQQSSIKQRPFSVCPLSTVLLLLKQTIHCYKCTEHLCCVHFCKCVCVCVCTSVSGLLQPVLMYTVYCNGETPPPLTRKHTHLHV